MSLWMRQKGSSGTLISGREHKALRVASDKSSIHHNFSDNNHDDLLDCDSRAPSKRLANRAILFAKTDTLIIALAKACDQI